MVRHIVLLKIKPDVSTDAINELFGDLVALKDKVPGIVNVDWGPNTSPEGKGQGFSYGFIMDFDTPASRDAYLPHPDHDLVKTKIINAITGVDDVLVFDYEV